MSKPNEQCTIRSKWFREKPNAFWIQKPSGTLE